MRDTKKKGYVNFYVPVTCVRQRLYIYYTHETHICVSTIFTGKYILGVSSCSRDFSDEFLHCRISVIL